MPGEGLRLADLSAAGEVAGDGSVGVSDVVHDSRDAAPGALFVAIRGSDFDGHDYVTAAAAAGAVAACVDHVLEIDLPQLVVPDTRRALAGLAAAVHDHPSRRLRLAGVTGTNGKTTVTSMLASIAEAAGLVPGVIGTVGARIGAESVPGPRTTPEASDLQRLLARMVAAGVGLGAVEVSSHALAYGRVEETWFETVAFTNLSQDHLDFHGTMDAYYDAKATLFTHTHSRHAVVGITDEWGRRLAGETGLPLTRVGLSPDADIRAEDVEAGLDASKFVAVTPEGSCRLVLPVGGSFNVLNALVAAGCALSIGIELDSVAAGLEGLPPVPGRFQAVHAGQPFTVVVDYAHTPEGVRLVVSDARRTSPGRVIVVVGAGGDRDRTKRPAMGAAAATADIVFFTSDNPRSEDPRAIVTQVSAGSRDGSAVVHEETDRREAIGLALREARPGDAVLILGKGHEQGQEIAGEVVPFDDRSVAEEELSRL